MSDKLYWHFLCADKRLQYADKREVVFGETIVITKKPVLCHVGLHASERAIDALEYAPGPIICRVKLGGEIVVGGDKVSAQERTVIAWADATNALHEFACRCAEDALRTAKFEDVRCWQAIETKRKWLKGEATDAELSAARDAAWAAWDAAWAAWAARAAARAAAWAARAAAWDAAWDAARAAARAAARDAAWDAARDAAWDAQNTRLESMFRELLGCD